MPAGEREAREDRFASTFALFPAHRHSAFPQDDSDYNLLQYYVDGCNSVHLLSLLMDEAIVYDRPARILGIIQKTILERCNSRGWRLGLPLPPAPPRSPDSTTSSDEPYIPPVAVE